MILLKGIVSVYGVVMLRIFEKMQRQEIGWLVLLLLSRVLAVWYLVRGNFKTEFSTLIEKQQRTAGASPTRPFCSICFAFKLLLGPIQSRLFVRLNSVPNQEYFRELAQ